MGPPGPPGPKGEPGEPGGGYMVGNIAYFRPQSLSSGFSPRAPRNKPNLSVKQKNNTGKFNVTKQMICKQLEQQLTS